MLIRFKQSSEPQKLENLIKARFPNFAFKVGGIYTIQLLTGALLLHENLDDTILTEFTFNKINGTFLYIKETPNLYVSTYKCSNASIEIQEG